MSNEAILLHRALQNVEQELERLGKLIDAKDGALSEELQADAGMISKLFKKKWLELKTECENIREEIGQRNAGSGDISALWASYTRVRYEGLPKLTGELLAVIGGIHLRKLKLDALGSPEVSFTEVAQQLLVKDLNDRSNDLGDSSLLIVAEERYEPSQALIFRLRFPACDIWHLPFTAYEHGYHSARDEGFTAVKNLRKRVEEEVDPTKYSSEGPPAEKACYLPEVQAYWIDFDREYAEIREQEERRAFRAAKNQEIKTLQDRQDVHLCRLLADAFATFYVGPAYTYALLHLSFEPIMLAKSGDGSADACVDLNKPISPWMPPFLQRLVVSLEILGWMHLDAINRGEKGFDESLFSEDPAQASGILGAYYQTCMAINGLTSPELLKMCYKATKKALTPWLDKFKGTIPQKNKEAKQTLDNWDKAQKLLPYFTEGKLDSLEDDKFGLWAIVNAAWHARHQKEIYSMLSTTQGSQTHSIEERATYLVREENPEVGKGTLPGRASGRVRVSQDPQRIRQEHIDKMRLAKQVAEEIDCTSVVDLLAGMIKRDSFRYEDVVTNFLQQTNKLGSSYAQAYQLLYEQDSRTTGSTEAQPRRNDDGFRR